MTILVTADLHLNNLPRDKYRHDFQQELQTLVKEYKVDIVAILGDLTDEKDFHSAQLVNKVVGHIHRLAQLAEVIIIKGNHDYTDITQTPYFAFLSRIDGVHWIGKPTLGKHLKNLPTSVTEAVDRVLFLPHSPNPTRDWADTPLKGHDWIFAHNTFEGALGDNGRALPGVPLNIFPKDARVLSGDIHVPQKVGPVTYVGSPYRIDFGDSYIPRILVIDDDDMHSVECRGPRKQLIQVKAGEAIKLDTKKIVDDLEPDDILKVKVEIEAHQYAQWNELKRDIQAWADRHKFIVNMIQPVKQGMTKKKLVANQPIKSDVEILKSFAKRQEVDEATTKLGLKLLGQV